MGDITAARLRELLHYNPVSGVFTRKVATANNQKVGEVVGSKHHSGYLYAMLDRKSYSVHRLAWLYVYGEMPKHTIDHINGVTSDNRLTNLRDVPRKVNSQNQRKAKASNKSTGVLGVHKSKGGKKYVAHIYVQGRLKHLGTFPTVDTARDAYVLAKRKFHDGCTI